MMGVGIRRRQRRGGWVLVLSVAACLVAPASAAGGARGGEDGVFVRFKLLEPKEANYYVRLGGYIHVSPWYFQRAIVPAGADRDAAKRVAPGAWTDWCRSEARRWYLIPSSVCRGVQRA